MNLLSCHQIRSYRFSTGAAAMILSDVFRSEEHRVRLFEAKVDELGAHLPPLHVPSGPPIPPELVGLGEPKLILLFVQKHLNVFIRQLVDDVISILNALVGRQTIEWCGNDVCKSHYYKSVIHRSLESTTIQTFRPSASDDFDAAEDGREATRVFTNAYRDARHEHSLINAKCHRPEDAVKAGITMPRNIAVVFEHIPTWLLAYVRIVDGNQYHERIIEVDTRSESETEVETVSRPVYQYDPAITLANYWVLAGWTNSETTHARQQHERESRRRNIAAEKEADDQKKERQQKEEAQHQATIAFTCVVVWHSFATLAGILAIFLAVGSPWLSFVPPRY